MLKILSLFWCFILTIWNVNPPALKCIDMNQSSFILTIWNVNTLPTFEVHKDDLKFYINYMEYK
ncbi:TPA: hypothetical protein ACSVRY_001518 [Clostridioides difficile]|uniref:hypothetical protein n=1 Tax=Clostridioides difficile TaxID=1496 RepID=UPI002411D3EC|nr:hypothetical protein [Clostridioides difficile]